MVRWLLGLGVAGVLAVSGAAAASTVAAPYEIGVILPLSGGGAFGGGKHQKGAGDPAIGLQPDGRAGTASLIRPGSWAWRP